MSAAALSEGTAPTGRRTIDEVLQSARRRITRLTPRQAKNDWDAGAVVVDIRPAAQRDVHGVLPGALVIERNVLEWRFDPTSDARLTITDYDLEIIVMCQEGYTSSLAAASLHDLGIHRATDVIGGYAPGASCSERETVFTGPEAYVSHHNRENARAIRVSYVRFPPEVQVRRHVIGEAAAGGSDTCVRVQARDQQVDPDKVEPE